MTLERMLELSLLLYVPNMQHFAGKPLDAAKMNKRRLELMQEFLEPYVIDSNSKE